MKFCNLLEKRKSDEKERKRKSDEKERKIKGDEKVTQSSFGLNKKMLNQFQVQGRIHKATINKFSYFM